MVNENSLFVCFSSNEESKKTYDLIQQKFIEIDYRISDGDLYAQAFEMGLLEYLNSISE
jgi:hypothetical protein